MTFGLPLAFVAFDLRLTVRLDLGAGFGLALDRRSRKWTKLGLIAPSVCRVRRLCGSFSTLTELRLSARGETYRERRPRQKPRLSGESSEQRDDLARTLDVSGNSAKQRVRPHAICQRPFLSLLKHE